MNFLQYSLSSLFGFRIGGQLSQQPKCLIRKTKSPKCTPKLNKEEKPKTKNPEP